MNQGTARHSGSRRWVIAIALLSLLFVDVRLAQPVEAQVTPDGLSSFTAAASCWEIKQLSPSAPSGVYWLVTPRLVAPEQFYCDMVTDGGGWVLIGRGREGWRTGYNGFGSTAQVREVTDGQAAFVPRQLSSEVIDGLLDGTRVDQMTDPIRLRRATDANGTSWQEGRFRFLARDRWVWTFGAEHRVGAWQLGTGTGSTGSGGQTNNFGNNNALRRVNTQATSAQGWTHGWAFGSTTTGTNSPTTYLWSNTNNAGFARPFTQLFIRPRLQQSDLNWAPVPDAGTAKQELRPLLDSGVLPGEWGVTGLANGRVSELAPEVSVFEQIGDRVYVGGNFRYVQRGQNATGAERVEQSYLAAFNVNTGAWLTDFRPTFNEQVKSLAALPDGTLAVGGEFTQANGQARPGFVRLNATTGAAAPGWQLNVENRTGGGAINVRAMDVQGGALYLGGLFTHVTTTGFPSAYMRMGAKVSATTGQPAANWNPDLNGSVIDLDASDAGTRVYMSGYFEAKLSGEAAKNAAALRTSDASLDDPAWSPVWSNSNGYYQQAIQEVDDRVWVGGAEHSFFSFDRSTFARLSGNITKRGGDFQTVADSAGVVYAGCHCNDWNYSNAYTWSNVGTNWTQADRISYVAAWDAATGQVIPQFQPIMRSRAGLGPWGAFEDSLGNVWFGGDIDRAERSNGTSQWAGAFVRYGPRDTTAPTTPGTVRVSAGAPGEIAVSWGASSGGPLSYEVLLDDRVVAVTNQTSLTIPVPAGEARLFVRAIDTTGNRSASTTAVRVEPPPEDLVELIGTGSSWRWRFESGAWPANWTSVGFDDAGWNTGTAVLGWGSAEISTNIDVPPPTSNRPLSAQFRRTFSVDVAGALSDVMITTRADDGVVVYVNGVEVGRANLPTGTLSSSTFATAAPGTAAAAANPLTIAVPSELLRDGSNVVSASTHLNYRGTPNVSFDLRLTAER